MDLDARYQSALDYLYSFVDFSLTKQLTYSPEKFNLDRMVQILALLGDPHLDYPTIHVTGTKGKGSVCAMLASILREADYHVGLFTSPHLIEYTERIQINGVPITHEEFVESLEQLKPYIAQVPGLTTFEITTALAMIFFAKRKVDLAIFEVGLGGRLDATNLIDPIVSVITTISYDHQAVLGNTLTQIAGEKAGIIKTNKPVVSSAQTGEALDEIIRVASREKCPIKDRGTRCLLRADRAHVWMGSHFISGRPINSSRWISSWKRKRLPNGSRKFQHTSARRASTRKCHDCLPGSPTDPTGRFPSFRASDPSRLSAGGLAMPV